MNAYAFDVPATTTVRVMTASLDAALAEIGEMQTLNWDLKHGNAVITELSLDRDQARLFEMNDRNVEGEVSEPENAETVEINVDQRGVHTVRISPNRFQCLTCGLAGDPDDNGYMPNESGAEEWHTDQS